MKRSQINQLIDNALEFMHSQQFYLPTWAKWNAEIWKTMGEEADEIRNHGLGWMVTDFGSKDFDKTGLLAFVIRNGRLLNNRPQTTKLYAEKMFVVQPEQVTPWHFHWMKTEDLINRGGGRLEVELAWVADDEKSFDEREVRVQVDGITRIIPAGGKLILEPGESVTLPPKLCHQFCGYKGDNKVLAGEISSLNDDTRDNCFLGKKVERSAIVEDEAAKYSLTGEYTIDAPRT
ncbi:MAG: D-lyxose/D-mannose family sugar isomerase [Candidatus Obscuribacterales bacterium]|nr:D-lyxose/D-mannose family sugar isomerase [Candidatus Obscuribacterales bacterium]